MNKKMQKNVDVFFDLVRKYIKQEYYSKYHKSFKDPTQKAKLWNTIAGYYLGGNNVPDTAGMIVDSMKREKHDI